MEENKSNKITTHIDSATKTFKNVLFWIGILLTILGGLTAGYNKMLDAKFSGFAVTISETMIAGIKKDMGTIISDINKTNSKVHELERSEKITKERNIMIQYTNIKSKYPITRIELEGAMSDYSTFEKPSDGITSAYLIIKQYYDNIY